MSDDGGRRAWPPDYTDPVVLRARFASRAARNEFFPAQAGSRAAWTGYVSDGEAAEALRRLGIVPSRLGAVQRVVEPVDPVTGEPSFWENPAERLDHMSGGAGRSDAGAAGFPKLNEGQQGKHVEGSRSYLAGRSTLSSEPSSLLRRFSGHGEQIGGIPVGQPGSKERFDAGEVIGIWRDQAGNEQQTTVGIIHYGKNGAHVVPAAPRGWLP